MNSLKHVFEPLDFGGVETKNRIETPPMLACMATPDGAVTREMIEFYKAFARGGSGIVTVGDAAVDFDLARGHLGQLNLADERIIGGLSTLVEEIQGYGALASIELNHAGRWAPREVLNGKSPIGPSPITPEGEEMQAIKEGRKKMPVIEMDQSMIDTVVDNFASAAGLCLRAGFKMIMVHGGHGHLVGQFTSPYSNVRTDSYGGSPENRARFALEVLSAIRRKVNKKLAIEYRISGDELVPGGMRVEDTIQFLDIIKDLIDLVHVSAGVVADPSCAHRMIQPTYLPHAYNVHLAEKIKKAIKLPVTCVGSVMDLREAEDIIAEGKADIVAMGRAQIADPEIVKKSYRGAFDEIRPCLRCSVCTDRTKNYLPVRCTVNPVAGRESGYWNLPPARSIKKVMIIGGGPAGMQAALTASSRGHDVTLYEKDAQLGGALRIASSPSFKADMKKYLEWMIGSLGKSSVQVKLSSKPDKKIIRKEKPDVLIVALGAEPVFPEIPGIKGPNTCWAGDVFTGKAKTGKSVVVAGAGLTGCEAALVLALQGTKVTVIDMITNDDVSAEAAFVNRNGLLQLLSDNGVTFHTEVKLEEINRNGVRVIDKNWKGIEIPADTVVISLGVKALSTLEYDGLAPEIYKIGDYTNPGNIMGAVHSAFTIASEI